MKSSIIVSALAFCLLAAPATQAFASSSESVNETLLPAKKTSKKSTKKTSTKKTKSKKTTTSKNTASKAASTKSTTAQVATTPAKVVDGTKAASNNVSESQSSSSSSAGSLLGGILSAVVGGSDGSATDNIISGLSTIFNSSKVATKDKIVGTWTYTEPAVVFSSNNALKNIGGKVASQTIENQLQNQFEKLGIKKGAMKMTFDKNGNFTQTVSGKTMSGTYTVSGKNVTLKYAGGIQQFVGTTQLDGNDLLIVMDASKLLKYANALGSLTGNSLLKSAGNLLGSMDGMEVGLKLDK